jgi:hypothetical protein
MGGSTAAHTSCARGQRVRNRQPEGGNMADGSSPRIAARSRAANCRGPATGTAASSPAV